MLHFVAPESFSMKFYKGITENDHKMLIFQ